MPYNPNYNYPYSPTMFSNQNFTTNTAGNFYYFVNGVEGAKAFQMQPNQTVLLMDSEALACYMKTSNSLGQSTLRYFKLEETDEATLRGNQNAIISAPTQDFALKSDIEGLNKKIEELTKKINKEEK